MFVTKAQDVDVLFSPFYKNINKVISKHAPKKKKKKKILKKKKKKK